MFACQLYDTEDPVEEAVETRLHGSAVLGSPVSGCTPFKNAAAVRGKIVVLERGEVHSSGSCGAITCYVWFGCVSFTNFSMAVCVCVFWSAVHLCGQGDACSARWCGGCNHDQRE